jgi:hypothetical protein
MGVVTGGGFLGGRPRLTGVATTSAAVEVDVRVGVMGLGLVGVRGASEATCPLNASMREEGGKEGLTGELRVTGLVGVATGRGIEASNFRLFLGVSGAANSTSSLSYFSAADGGAGAVDTTSSISGSRGTNTTRFFGLSFEGNSRSFFVDSDLGGTFKVDAAVGDFVGDSSSISLEEDAKGKTRGLTGEDRRMDLGRGSNFRFFEGVSGTTMSTSSSSEESSTSSMRGFCVEPATGDWAGARFGVSFDGNSRSFRGEVRLDGVEAEAVGLIGDMALLPALRMRV